MCPGPLTRTTPRPDTRSTHERHHRHDDDHRRSTRPRHRPTAETPAADDHIAALRTRIDEIDQTLIELWQERAAISHEVGVTRVAAGGTRLVLAREQEILDRFRDALGADGTQLAC